MASPVVVAGVCGGVEVKRRVGGASTAQDVAGGWAMCELSHACRRGGAGGSIQEDVGMR